MENTRLTKADWLRAARLALLEGGVASVRVEVLAKRLHVTKGSFYWHFKDRGELLEALLREWEEEKSFLVELAGKGPLRERLANLFTELQRRVTLSEQGEWPSDAAIFGWAAVSSKVAVRAKKEEEKRIQLFGKMLGNGDDAEYFYMAYLGFILRRRRVPEAAKNFSILVQKTMAFLGQADGKRKEHRGKAESGRNR